MKYIGRLAHHLEGLQSPSLSELEAALKSALPSRHEYAPLIKPPQKLAYGRHVLYSSPQVEAILIHLPPMSRTAIHDHGGSIGCSRILEGEMTHVIHTLDEYGYPVQERVEVVTAGGTVRVPSSLIHEMVNRSLSQRMISLHLYAPPLRHIEVYKPYDQVLDYII